MMPKRPWILKEEEERRKTSECFISSYSTKMLYIDLYKGKKWRYLTDSDDKKALFQQKFIPNEGFCVPP